MLTRKQLDLLEFIHRRVQRDGVSPSFDEMKDALDLRSKSGIHRLISALEERGFIRRLAHRARAIEVLKLPENLPSDRLSARRPAPARLPVATTGNEVPMMGRIAAGTPIEAIEHVSHHVSVPDQMVQRGGEHFALEVRGDSMIDA